MKKISFISSIALLIFAGSVYAAPTPRTIFTDNSVIIYGSQDKATSKDENLIAFNLKKQMKSYVNMWADNKIGESTLKKTNLIILGHDKSNSILNFSNMPNVKSNFPITINDDSFTFGDKEYLGKNDAIAFMYPSPYNAKNYTLIMYGNTLSGLENLAKNMKITGNNEYQIVGEKGIIREGRFNKDSFVWKYDPNMDNDYSPSSDN